MQRVTHRDPDGNLYSRFDYNRVLATLERYEDAVEQGRISITKKSGLKAVSMLIDGEEFRIDGSRLADLLMAEKDGRLHIQPCKVGDTVYRIVKNRKSKERPKGAAYIRTIVLTENNFSRIVLGCEFGKSVFLTYEDAEDALEGSVDV